MARTQTAKEFNVENLRMSLWLQAHKIQEGKWFPKGDAYSLEMCLTGLNAQMKAFNRMGLSFKAELGEVTLCLIHRYLKFYPNSSRLIALREDLTLKTAKAVLMEAAKGRGK